jgi:putative two-component system response regulator
VTSWPSDARILLVDDEPANVRLLERLLAQAGYRCVLTFTDPAELVATAAAEVPDLVLLDVHMPGLDGFDLMRVLRRLSPPDEYVPMLVLTADATPRAREKALGAGATDFLTKPFDLTEVRLRVRNLLEVRGLHRKLAAQNGMLREQVQDRTRDLHESRLELLHRLALAAELRDEDTYDHTVRVGRNAGRLADALGLPPEQCLLIEHAAPLHDIGKIGISDAILLKPGPLTEEEFAQIRTHSEVGARILGGSSTDVLCLAETIALQHHERWDGTGYPHGVAGGAIALPARIVAVVDVFDALTHARPYKEAWPVERAVAEMQRMRARHFDPETLDVFLGGVHAGAYAEEEMSR